MERTTKKVVYLKNFGIKKIFLTAFQNSIEIKIKIIHNLHAVTSELSIIIFFLGDMFFNKLQHIADLYVEGYVNNKNFTEYLTQIVNCTEDCVFHEEFVFEEPVSKIYKKVLIIISPHWIF